MLYAETLPSECPSHRMFDRWSANVQVTLPASGTLTCKDGLQASELGPENVKNHCAEAKATPALRAGIPEAA